jgi:hypothetical protein
MKTAKEKAIELVDKYENAIYNYFTYTGDGIEVAMLAKQSALIAVDEMLLIATEIDYGIKYFQVRDYILEVKSEIEKL